MQLKKNKKPLATCLAFHLVMLPSLSDLHVKTHLVVTMVLPLGTNGTKVMILLL